MDQRSNTESLWPDPLELPPPAIMDQRWTDAIFLHWRIPANVAARFMPPGVQPDLFDNSSWVGLIGFRMKKAGIGRGPGIPYLGSFNVVNVHLYSREPDGTRSVVFLSLDANRLPVVLAARAAEIPYACSRIRYSQALEPLRSAAQSPALLDIQPGKFSPDLWCQVGIRMGNVGHESLLASR